MLLHVTGPLWGLQEAHTRQQLGQLSNASRKDSRSTIALRPFNPGPADGGRSSSRNCTTTATTTTTTTATATTTGTGTAHCSSRR